MDPCRTVVAAYDERSVASVVEEVDDSACDKGDKPPASRSAWRYCNPPNSADFARRRVSLPAEALENYLHRMFHTLKQGPIRKVTMLLFASFFHYRKFYNILVGF